jgi:hypothetical protein
LIIDNGCSTSITNELADFIFPPFKVNASIQGYSGSTTATHIGTVCWKIEDDLVGAQHDIILPKTYYSPKGKHRLLCPQHWAQVANDHSPQLSGTWCGTYADHVTLYWEQQKYKRTVALLPNTANVGIIYTTPGIRKYANICNVLENKLTTLVMPTMIDLTGHTEPSAHSESVPVSEGVECESVLLSKTQTNAQQESLNNQPIPFQLEDVLGEGDSIPEVEHPEFSLAQQELLHLHYCYVKLNLTRVKHLKFSSEVRPKE